MIQNRRVARCIDIVFCVDGAGSMAPFAAGVKDFIRRFINETIDQYTMSGSDIDDLRAKVVSFRDYRYDKQDVVCESPFFQLPIDDQGLDEYLSKLSFYGGGPSGKRNGLEALYQAMKSDFVTGVKDRQIIVLITNGDCYELRECASEVEYPIDMVDENGFIETWMGYEGGNIREKCKRLAIFAPQTTKYEQLRKPLNRTCYCCVNDMSQLATMDIKVIHTVFAAG